MPADGNIDRRTNSRASNDCKTTCKAGLYLRPFPSRQGPKNEACSGMKYACALSQDAQQMTLHSSNDGRLCWHVADLARLLVALSTGLCPSWLDQHDQPASPRLLTAAPAFAPTAPNSPMMEAGCESRNNNVGQQWWTTDLHGQSATWHLACFANQYINPAG